MSNFGIVRLPGPAAWFRASARVLNQRILPCIERPISALGGDLKRRPPTFIIGPPRCGSTLAIQVLTEALDLGFISNAHAAWFGAPAVAELAIRCVRRRIPSDFRSDLGRTVGLHAPSECPAWWYRFFPRRPPYVGPADLDSSNLAGFRRSIEAFTATSGRPLVFKNLYASLRIHPIVASVPESIFIVIKRPMEDVARSLLAARLREFGTHDQWLSVEPPNVEELRRLPPFQQVLGQVESIYKLIRADLASARVSMQRVFDLDFQALCADPGECVQRYQEHLRLLGVSVASRRLVSPDVIVKSEGLREIRPS